jgi:hypothetical protein
MEKEKSGCMQANKQGVEFAWQQAQYDDISIIVLLTVSKKTVILFSAPLRRRTSKPCCYC